MHDAAAHDLAGGKLSPKSFSELAGRLAPRRGTGAHPQGGGAIERPPP